MVLAVPEWTRQRRVVTRHLRLLRHATPAQWPTFLPTLIELLKHNRAYDQGPLAETLAQLAPFEEKLQVCRSNAEADRLLGLS